MNLVMQLVICLATIASVTACTTGQSRRTLPVGGPGDYVFQLKSPIAGQAVTTSLSQEIARSITDGAGEKRIDRAASVVQCAHRFVAISGPAVTKLDFECRLPDDAKAEDGQPVVANGTWSRASGVAIATSNFRWPQRDAMRRALFEWSAVALENLFGGLWRPGTQRQVDSLAVLKLVSPVLDAAPGKMTQGTLAFVGIVDRWATFALTGEVRYDDLEVDVKGTVVLDVETGWPAKLVFDVQSAQDMAHVSYRLEKTVSPEP